MKSLYLKRVGSFAYAVFIPFFNLCTEISSPIHTPGSPQISGSIMQPDGRNYAANACVTIRYKNCINSLTDKFDINFFACSTFTDNEGKYGFSGIPTGDYLVEGKNGCGDFVLISDSVSVSKDNSTIVLEPAILKSAGKLLGRIHLSEGGFYDSLLILIRGLNRYVNVDNRGFFVFNDIPEGEYQLIIFPGLKYYGVYDTGNVTVVAGTVTELRINLVSKYVPPPESLIAFYDSNLQIVTLSWKKPCGREGLRYNVFRIIEGEEDTLLTHDPVVDTFYCDDAAPFLYKNVTYAVSAIDSNINQSDTIYYGRIFITSLWKEDRIIPSGEVRDYSFYPHEIQKIKNNTSIYSVDFDISADKIDDIDSIRSLLEKKTPALISVDDHSFSCPGLNKKVVRTGYGLFVIFSCNESSIDDGVEHFQTIYYIDGRNGMLYRTIVVDGDIEFLEERAGLMLISQSGSVERYILSTE